MKRKRIPRILFVVGLFPAALCSWITALLLRGRVAEAFFCGYLAIALLTGVLLLIVVAVSGSSNLLMSATRIQRAARGKWSRAAAALESASQNLSGSLNWPGLALIFYLYARRMTSHQTALEKLRSEIKAATFMLEEAVLWMPVSSAFLCALFFIVTRQHVEHPRHMVACFSVFALAVLARHVNTLQNAGKLLPLLRKTPGSPTLRFVAVLICDFSTLVLSLTAIHGLLNRRDYGLVEIEGIAQVLISPKALLSLLTPDLHAGFLQHAWSAPGANKITVVAGSLFYTVLLQTALGGLSEFKRTEDDKISVARFLCARGDFHQAQLTLGEVNGISLSREYVRVLIHLALGNPAKAAGVARWLLAQLDDEEREQVAEDEVYAFLLKHWLLTQMPDGTDLKLWQWGLTRPISQALRVYHISMVIGDLRGGFEKLANFFPQGTEITAPLASSVFYMLLGRPLEALAIVDVPAMSTPEEELTQLVVLTCARTRLLDPADRKRFADDFPEAWKDRLLGIFQQLSEGRQWKGMLALFLGRFLQGVWSEAGSSNVSWLDQETQRLLIRVAEHQSGAEAVRFAQDLMKQWDRGAKRERLEKQKASSAS